MISRSEQMDIPDIKETEQQARIAALGITISQFQKTLQGRAIIERQERFILNGMIFQGYNQKAIEVPEDLCTDDEIAETHDIDGSKHRVIDTRRRRFEGNAHAKDKEQAERRRGKIAQERDELELVLLKRRIRALDPDDPEPETDPDPDSQPDTSATPEPKFFSCEVCTKAFQSMRGLRMHRVGAKH